MSEVDMDVVPKKVWVMKGVNLDTDKIEVYGTGQYLGRKPFKFGSGVIDNPYIELDDNRGHVWGIMCWWTTSEERYNEVLGMAEVELVDPPVDTPLPYTGDIHA